MPDELYEHIGSKIRSHREKTHGMTQEQLAAELDVTANTVSRWETAVYKPTIADLVRLGRLFGVAIWAFLPSTLEPPAEAQQALLGATGDLPEEDLEELQRYADFIRARKPLKGK